MTIGVWCVCMHGLYYIDKFSPYSIPIVASILAHVWVRITYTSNIRE